MLSWASSQIEKIAQTVAPPPTDPASRFLYCCQRGEENEAMQLASQLPGSGVIVNPTKQQVALHVSCTHGMMQLTRHLLNQPGASLDMLDGSGNTMLHCAAMCTQPAGLELVKMLVNEMSANVCAKNYQGQTPYDVASLNNIRQFLLPIQLQQETREALANGGQGLPPGIDMGGLKIQNMAPPPPMGMPGGSPQAGPPPPVGPPPQGMPPAGGGVPASPYPQPPNPFGESTPIATPPPAAAGTSPYPQPPYSGATTPSHQQVGGSMPPAPVQPVAAPVPPMQPTPPPPAAANAGTPPEAASGYALVGSSSAAIYKPPPGSGGIRPDGFHSSSSDKRLQQKYGHANASQYAHIPPPPSSGSSLGALSGASGTAPAAPASGGANPYAGGLAHRQRPNRYVNYNPITGQAAAAPAAVPRPYSSYGAPAVTANAPAAPTQFNVFRPGGAPAPAPASGGTPTPPPPFQQQPAGPTPAYPPPPQSAPSVFAQQTATPSYTPQQQAPAPQASPFAKPPAVTTPAPAAVSRFATPPALSSPPPAAPSSGNHSASALFSSPAGEASTAFSSSAPAQAPPVKQEPVTSISPAVSSPAMPAPPLQYASPNKSNTSSAANAFSSPPPPAVAATPAVVAVPEQVSFGNRDVSGVSVMSNASDFFSKSGGSASAVDAFASPAKAAGESSQAASASPGKSPDQPTQDPTPPAAERTTTPSNDLVHIEEEDFDKMDDIPLSPQAIPNRLDGSQVGQTTQPSSSMGMPPPPFSST